MAGRKKKKTPTRERRHKVVHRALRPKNGAARSSQRKRGPTLKSLKSALRENPADWEARLLYAETLVQKGKAAEAVRIIDERFDNSLLAVDEDLYVRITHVLSQASAAADQLSRARDLAQKALTVEPDGLDFHYVLAYSACRLREFAVALAAADDYLALVRLAPATDRQSRLRRTRDRKYEVWNYRGLSLQGLERHEEALESFANATDSKPDSEVAWQNRLMSLKHLGRDEEAVEVLLQARENCPKSLKFGKVRSARQLVESAPLVSLCMIVKNEEHFLSKCLEGAKPLCDEIIVVDTGSTDRTPEIAREHGAKVYFHEWENDFSKARNISIDYATGEWVLILDADEQLQPEHIGDLRETLRTTDFHLISLTVYNYSREQAMYTSFLPSVRLFRREKKFRYEGIVHNQLKFPPEEGILRVPISLIHYGYGLEPEAMKKKIARSKALLLAQLEENPKHGFAHFNLAQLLRGEDESPSEERMREVLDHALSAVNLCSPDDPKVRHIHLMALHQVVTAYFNLGDYNQAATYCHRALELKPDYLDPIISLGHIHSMTGETAKARQYFVEYLDRQRQFSEHEETDQIILLHLRSRQNAYYGLGLVSGMEEKWRESIDWFERSLKERNDYIDTYFQMGNAYRAIGDLEHARSCFENQLRIDSSHLESRIKLAAILFDLENLGAAAAVLKPALAQDAKHPMIRYLQAKILSSDGQLVEAINSLDQVIAEQPKWLQAQRFRADLLLQNQDYESALKAYAWILEQDRNDQNALLGLGNCHFKCHRFEDAIVAYSQLLSREPDNLPALRNWALALHRSGRIEEATDALTTYCERTTDDLDALEVLGNLLCQRRDYAGARRWYELILVKQPRSMDVLMHLSDCYFNMGVVDAALLGYRQVLQYQPDHAVAHERIAAIEAYEGQQKAGVSA